MLAWAGLEVAAVRLTGKGDVFRLCPSEVAKRGQMTTTVAKSTDHELPGQRLFPQVPARW